MLGRASIVQGLEVVDCPGEEHLRISSEWGEYRAVGWGCCLQKRMGCVCVCGRETGASLVTLE